MKSFHFRFTLAMLGIMILLTGCAQSSLPEGQLFSVPQGTPPTIDGVIDSAEWNAARVETFADGSELLTMRDAEYLYLAIRGTTEEMIAANVYTKENGEIFIHHASAALGTAIYQPAENSWLKTQDFHWQCRASDNSEASQTERSAFLDQEGWLAATSRRGTPNELEYQIKITAENLPLAVAFMRTSDPEGRIFLPLDLADDTIQPTPDGLPEIRLFSPETWMLLDLTN
ncbi:MAG: hypothetical protein K8R16_12080 [Anaerolineales bacterium]|nr:hypothetical protein [Anaerolineales bacterium]